MWCRGGGALQTSLKMRQKIGIEVVVTLINDECYSVDVVNTDDEERSDNGLVDCLLAAEGASSLVVKNHDDTCLAIALQSLPLRCTFRKRTVVSSLIVIVFI